MHVVFDCVYLLRTSVSIKNHISDLTLTPSNFLVGTTMVNLVAAAEIEPTTI